MEASFQLTPPSVNQHSLSRLPPAPPTSLYTIIWMMSISLGRRPEGEMTANINSPDHSKHGIIIWLAVWVELDVPDWNCKY